MSETQTSSCNNACGDAVEVRNSTQVNLENTEISQQNNLKNPSQSGTSEIAQVAGGDNELKKDSNVITKESAEAIDNSSNKVLQLQEEVSKRTLERDCYRKKLEETESKLNALQSTLNSSSNNQATTDANLHREIELLRKILAQTKQTLTDRERQVTNQDHQISALSKQVSSLKEVVAITKDMLNIRNMEVKHLKEDVDKMEMKINSERDRHNSMLNKMDAAVRLNADLKKEYQTQLQLFQDLRGKYEEKVTLLSEENKALESAVQVQSAQ